MTCFRVCRVYKVDERLVRSFSQAGRLRHTQQPSVVDRLLALSRYWAQFRVLHVSGSGKIPRETAGVPREREERPSFIPRECRERDCLLRESRGTGTKAFYSRGTGSHPRFPSRPIVTAVRPIYHYRCIYAARYERRT